MKNVFIKWLVSFIIYSTFIIIQFVVANYITSKYSLNGDMRIFIVFWGMLNCLFGVLYLFFIQKVSNILYNRLK